MELQKFKIIDIQIIFYNSLEKIEVFLKYFPSVEIPDGFKVKFHFVSHDKVTPEKYKNVISKYLKEDQYTFNINENIGFGAGHNWLFEKYGANYEEYFLVLNPDTILFYDLFTNFIDFSQKAEKWGIIECMQFPHENPKYYNPETFETNWCVASGIFIKKEAFELVGGFDDNIFMYGEDVDLSWRILSQGYKLYHFPKARITHINNSSTASSVIETESPFAVKHMQAAELYLTEKYKLDNKVGVEWLRTKSPYKEEILEMYKKMTKNGIPKVVASKDINIKSYKNYRWII